MTLIRYSQYSVGLGNVNNIIDNHLQQQPKHIFCADCGKALQPVKKDIDVFDNIHIKVERCTCRDLKKNFTP